eukprot:1157903-Pelagomonas_calceolata.AAC.8
MMSRWNQSPAPAGGCGQHALASCCWAIGQQDQPLECVLASSRGAQGRTLCTSGNMAKLN